MATILPDLNQKENIYSETTRFFKQAKLGVFLHRSNIHKVKGVSALSIIRFVFSLVLHGMSFSRALKSDRIPKDFRKDVVYDLLKNPTYNWRKLLVLVSTYLIEKFIRPLTSERRDCVLIFDDSAFYRNRSKCVELLARAKDHAHHVYFKGFRMLTLGWSDGATFLPLAFSHLSSPKAKNRFQEMDSSIDKRTVGYKRRKEAIQKTTETMFNLLDAVDPEKLGAKAVLFDSWFAFPSTIAKIVRNYSLDVVCMLKDLPRVSYHYEGQSYRLSQLYKMVRKKRGRAKILASIVVGLGHNDEYGQEIQARIVFVRDRNRSKKWLALLTTNMNHTDEDVVRIYGKRWDIECFFKVTKSYLKLGKEFQCQSYDSMFAHTTIVFLRYLMLSLRAREEEDPRTLGQLFYMYCEEIDDIQFAEALLTIIEALGQTLAESFLLTDEKIQDFLDCFINKLPSFLQKPLLKSEAA
ncbi:transposase [Heyndrickxia coagulans]|uniref:IS4 family transposase n=2 Tax=Bacillaceae TaxID=186817 RepID=UPI0021B4C010|nr:transposase [Heyndrickxia coagulans]UXC22779.1 transposase [Heyndrickxia coagulans]